MRRTIYEPHGGGDEVTRSGALGISAQGGWVCLVATTSQIEDLTTPVRQHRTRVPVGDYDPERAAFVDSVEARYHVPQK